MESLRLFVLKCSAPNPYLKAMQPQEAKSTQAGGAITLLLANCHSQTGCSDLASAPELSPCGARAAATSPPAFVNKPCPFSNSYLTSNLLNLTHTTLHSTLFAIADKRRPSPSNGGNAVHQEESCPPTGSTSSSSRSNSAKNR